MTILLVVTVAVDVYAATGITLLLWRSGALRWDSGEVSDR